MSNNIGNTYTENAQFWQFVFIASVFVVVLIVILRVVLRVWDSINEQRAKLE
jgi:hypothetical protein